MLATFAAPNSPMSFSLLQAEPFSGRTHQIRVHAAEMGFPLVGDRTYGQNASVAWCPSLFLHCWQMSLLGVDSRQAVSLSAELPQVLRSALYSLTLLSGDLPEKGINVNVLSHNCFVKPAPSC